MADAADMSTPVTRGELREELQRFKLEVKQELKQELGDELRQELASKKDLESGLATLASELRQELASKKDLEAYATKKDLEAFATKKDLEIWGGALLARVEDLHKDSHNKLMAEIARLTRAVSEQMSKEISVVDEKYADVPERVNRLETAVFGTKPG